MASYNLKYIIKRIGRENSRRNNDSQNIITEASQDDRYTKREYFKLNYNGR